MAMKIENLRSVTLEVEITGKTGDKKSDSFEPVRLEFIYGVATSGLTPYERDLQEMVSGEHFEKVIPGMAIREYLGTLYSTLVAPRNLLIFPEHFVIRTGVISVRASEEKEVVKAIASSLSHGCGHTHGGCDCGCS